MLQKQTELLDELGILRLDPALKQYATQLESQKNLNQFERAQAVTTLF